MREQETHILDFVGVEVEDVLVLEADEVEGARGAAPHNAHTLRPRQHRLQLLNVPRVDLRAKHFKVRCALLLLGVPVGVHTADPRPLASTVAGHAQEEQDNHKQLGAIQQAAEGSRI